MESRAVGRVCLGGRVAYTGWEEGGGRARRPEGVKGREERGRNQSSVPPAVPQGGRRADVMSEFGHLSSRKYTHTNTHTHTMRGSNSTNGRPPLTLSSKARVILYGCAPDPHAPLLVPRGERPYWALSHQRPP